MRAARRPVSITSASLPASAFASRHAGVGIAALIGMLAWAAFCVEDQATMWVGLAVALLVAAGRCPLPAVSKWVVTSWAAGMAGALLAHTPRLAVAGIVVWASVGLYASVRSWVSSLLGGVAATAAVSLTHASCSTPALLTSVGSTLLVAGTAAAVVGCVQLELRRVNRHRRAVQQILQLTSAVDDLTPAVLAHVTRLLTSWEWPAGAVVACPGGDVDPDVRWARTRFAQRRSRHLPAPEAALKLAAVTAVSGQIQWADTQASTPDVAAAHPRIADLLNGGCMIAAPVCVDSRQCVAVVVLASDRPFRHPPEETAELLRFISAVLGLLALSGRTKAARFDADERRQQLVDLSADAVIGVSGGLILSWNIAAERLFGHRPIEAVGQQVTSILGELPHGSSTAPGRAQMRRVDGSSFVADVRVAGDSGEQTITVRDVTEEVQANAAISELSERNSRVLRIAGCGIVEVDAAGMIRYANPAAELVFRDWQMLGRHISAWLPMLWAGRGDERPSTDEHLSRVTAYRSDGMAFPATVVATPTPNGGGLVLSVIDASGREEAERAQRELDLVALARVHAIELNDTVVQGLASALLALELGDASLTAATLQSTLAEARALIATLVGPSETELLDLLRRKTSADLGVAEDGGQS